MVADTGNKGLGGTASTRLWLRLVGDFEATLGSGESALPVSKKARALLALLAAHMPNPVRRDFAASLLWSSKPKDHAANSLRQALRELQLSVAACGEPPILVTGGGRLSLRAEAVWIDIHDPSEIRWKPHADGLSGPLLLCQNLQGLDTAFDMHLERLWKNLIFQQAFAPVNEDPQSGYSPLGPSLQSWDGHQDDYEESWAAHGSPLGTPTERDAPKQDDGTAGPGWRIAVLPFRSLGNAHDAGLALGMAEEISAAMARYRMPRLIATGSFWDGNGPVGDALKRCKAYALDYAISGTIQIAGPRVRVTVSLLDVSMDFEVIWASRFEGAVDNLFTLQDEIASHTVAQIDPELLRRHQFHGESARTLDSQAHQSVLTAIQAIYRPDKARFLAAKDLLFNAIELDPDYAAAHAWLAYWSIMAVGQGWADNPAAAGEMAGRAAERSIALDPLDARGVSIAGHVKAYMLHEVEASLPLHQRAISLNPHLPIAWTLSACAHIYNGDHALAVEQAKTAVSLSPNDPHVFFAEHVLQFANMMRGNLEDAEQLAASVLAQKPGHVSALNIRIGTLGMMGRTAEAAEYIEQLKRFDPHPSVRSISSRPPLRPHDRERYAEGLRRAGLPEVDPT